MLNCAQSRNTNTNLIKEGKRGMKESKTVLLSAGGVFLLGLVINSFISADAPSIIQRAAAGTCLAVLVWEIIVPAFKNWLKKRRVPGS